MSRLKAIAVRCQLLVGSFDGAQRVCPCPRSDDCKLTRDQRKEYEKLIKKRGE